MDNYDFIRSLKTSVEHLIDASTHLNGLCRIALVNQLDQLKRHSISLNELKNFDLDLFNQSHLILNRRNMSPKQSNSYLASLVSVLTCLMHKLTQPATATRKNATDSFDLDSYVGADLQPVLYVVCILFVFTIIFGLIMMFSYRFNRQDAEIVESKMILKDWKSFKNRPSVDSAYVQRLITLSDERNKSNKNVKFKIEDWSNRVILSQRIDRLSRRYSSEF